MKFFTRAASRARGTEEGRRDWQRRIDAYLRHLESIGPSLPESARRLARLGLHDSRIVKVDEIGPQELRLTLDTRAAFAPHPEVVLTFRQVRDKRIPPEAAGTVWLFEEVHQSKVAAFELRVLLPQGELRVAAGELAIHGCYPAR
jgi:hypothetical protein